jgi:hypothetical protein
MTEPTQNQERVWERGWEGHELAQLQRMARLPLSEKLDWLEQAHVFVLNMQRNQARGRAEAEANSSAESSCEAGDLPFERSHEHSTRRPPGEAP